MMMELELFVIRDQRGYVIASSEEEISEEEINKIFGSTEPRGWWSRENSEDWCPHCGDMDAYPRLQQGGNPCCDELGEEFGMDKYGNPLPDDEEEEE